MDEKAEPEPKTALDKYYLYVHHWRCKYTKFNPTQKKLTNNSSTVVLHFSKLIRLIAHISFRGLHQADCTTAVAPAPTSNKNAVVDEHLHLN